MAMVHQRLLRRVATAARKAAHALRQMNDEMTLASEIMFRPAGTRSRRIQE